MNFATMDGYYLDKVREDVPTYQFEKFMDSLGVEFSFFLFVSASLMTIPVLYASPKPLFEGGKFAPETTTDGASSSSQWVTFEFGGLFFLLKTADDKTSC